MFLDQLHTSWNNSPKSSKNNFRKDKLTDKKFIFEIFVRVRVLGPVGRTINTLRLQDIQTVLSILFLMILRKIPTMKFAAWNHLTQNMTLLI